MKTVLALLTLLTTVTVVHAQGLPPCAKIFSGFGVGANPDSVAVDTCIGSPTYNQLYARQWFDVEFDVAAIDPPWYPNGSLVDTTWDAIDTAYSDTRQAFADLEDSFGDFIFRKTWPGDTAGRTSRMFRLRFDNYANIDSVEKRLKAIDHVFSSGYIQRLMMLDDGIPEEIEPEEPGALQLVPNPAEKNVAVNMAIPSSSTAGTLRFCDMRGNLVLTAPFPRLPGDTIVDISLLSAGAYVVSCGPASAQLIVR